MNSANWREVSSPRASASSMALRSATMSRIRCSSSGLAPARASRRHPNWGSRTSRRRRGPGGVGWELLELCLGQAGRVRGVGEQGLALPLDGLVEQLPDPLQGAVEAAALAQLARPRARLAK